MNTLHWCCLEIKPFPSGHVVHDLCFVFETPHLSILWASNFDFYSPRSSIFVHYLPLSSYVFPSCFQNYAAPTFLVIIPIPSKRFPKSHFFNNLHEFQHPLYTYQVQTVVVAVDVSSGSGITNGFRFTSFNFISFLLIEVQSNGEAVVNAVEFDLKSDKVCNVRILDFVDNCQLMAAFASARVGDAAHPTQFLKF